jgi:hypothetical protein
VTDLLAETEAHGSYLTLQELVLTSRGEITEVNWNAAARTLVETIVKQLCGDPALGADVAAFLAWPQVNPPQEGEAVIPARHDNLFAYPSGAPKVWVRLGSIHSVKGETHTATLVLDSFYHNHHLRELKPWLLGAKTGGSTVNKKGKTVVEGSRMLGRLKLHYVAMTRPTHLLCLAMRKDAFVNGELDILRGRGWTIIDCCDTVES